MLRRLNPHHAHGKRRNVAGEANAAHEFGEPRPHRIAVKLSQQRSVMKADPPAPAFLDVFPERGHRRRVPPVRGIIQLKDQPEPRQERFVKAAGVFDVFDGEAAGVRLARQPHFGRVDEWLVQPPFFGDGQCREPGRLRLGETHRIPQRRQNERRNDSGYPLRHPAARPDIMSDQE